MPDNLRVFVEPTRSNLVWIFLLSTIIILLACFYLFSWRLPVLEPVFNSRQLLDIFAQSPAAIKAGFSENETLSLAEPPFFQAYSNLVSRLAVAKKTPFIGSVNQLAAMSMLVDKAIDLEQRRAVLQAFFRYYPDILSDPVVFSRIVVLLNSSKMVEKNELIRQEIRQTSWKLASAAIELAKVSGARSLPELAELSVLFPDLTPILREALNPATPVAESVPLISRVSGLSETLPPAEPEDAT